MNIPLSAAHAAPWLSPQKTGAWGTDSTPHPGLASLHPRSSMPSLPLVRVRTSPGRGGCWSTPWMGSLWLAPPHHSLAVFCASVAKGTVFQTVGVGGGGRLVGKGQPLARTGRRGKQSWVLTCDTICRSPRFSMNSKHTVSQGQALDPGPSLDSSAHPLGSPCPVSSLSHDWPVWLFTTVGRGWGTTASHWFKQCRAFEAHSCGISGSS